MTDDDARSQPPAAAAAFRRATVLVRCATTDQMRERARDERDRLAAQLSAQEKTAASRAVITGVEMREVLYTGRPLSEAADRDAYDEDTTIMGREWADQHYPQFDPRRDQPEAEVEEREPDEPEYDDDEPPF